MATTGYSSDLSAAQWALIEPHIPPAKPGGRPRETDMCAVVNAVFYLLRTGCQWRFLPKDFLHGERSGRIFGVGVKRVSGFGSTERSILSFGPKPGAGKSRVL